MVKDTQNETLILEAIENRLTDKVAPEVIENIQNHVLNIVEDMCVKSYAEGQSEAGRKNFRNMEKVLLELADHGLVALVNENEVTVWKATLEGKSNG